MIQSDTIVASATAPGRGAISIIRLSGPNSLKFAQQLSRKTLTPRHALYGSVILNGELIDTGIWIYFKGPNSFTGEDTVEFQGHGGPLVIQAVLKAMTQLGARLAQPGEFSQRAFLNGKIDLTQAEAISDLINASSLSAVKAANQSLRGEFAFKIDSIVQQIIAIRTQIEAHIDFPDEDIDPTNIDQFKRAIEQINDHLIDVIQNAQLGARLNQLTDIVLIGEPNVGKSSLLNALAKEPLAIVTDVPGTTRDLIRHNLIIDGLELRITDTAGIRATTDAIEQEGINRAVKAIEDADIVLCLFDNRSHSITNHDIDQLTGISQTKAVGLIQTKSDITHTIHNQTSYPFLKISAKTGDGLPNFKSWLLTQLNLSPTSETPFLARERHVEQLNKASLFITAAMCQSISTETIELVAEDLRLAQKNLSEITGSFTSDDLLTSIFSTFCIGK